MTGGHPGESNGSPDDREHRIETMPCPACETQIAVEDNFCRACGADVSGIDRSNLLTACPSCGVDVDPSDSFCRKCGHGLDAHRPEAGETTTAGAGPDGPPRGEPADAPDAAGSETAATGGDPPGASPPENPARAAEGADEPQPATGDVGEPEPVTNDVGEQEQAPAPEEGEGAPAGDEADDEPRLSLAARGREFDVGDGDVVGKEIRRAILDTGGDREDAVRVHREHVRIEHEDDGFYLVDLGQNPTAVNGETLEQGDRVPVGAGDRIDLSGVASIDVRRG